MRSSERPSNPLNPYQPTRADGGVDERPAIASVAPTGRGQWATLVFLLASMLAVLAVFLLLLDLKLRSDFPNLQDTPSNHEAYGPAIADTIYLSVAGLFSVLAIALWILAAVLRRRAPLSSSAEEQLSESE